MISAQAYTDDRNLDFKFDCLPFFEQATDNQILDLHRCGWGGDMPSDVVAIFMADTIDLLKDMFRYLEIIANDPMKKDYHGFECHVLEDAAKEWLNEHRPHLMQLIKAEEEKEA